MAQSIFTKHYGEIRFIRTWAQSGGKHIGLMPSGAYAHIGGLPVTNIADIQACIPAGDELEKALAWFENRGKVSKDHTPVRKVYYDPDDGSWRYVDSYAVVAQVEDLQAALKGGPLADALVWFQRQMGAKVPGATPAQPLESPQDRVLDLLREDPGQSVQQIAKGLSFDLRATSDLLAALRDEQQIGIMGKLYYLLEDLAAEAR